MKNKFAVLVLALTSMSALSAPVLAGCVEGVFCDRAGTYCRVVAICCNESGMCRAFWAQN